ncbi:putative co/zn/cd efflux system membrane fusion protein [hydrocarbon metagenome]|uniref:Putative co/zn/cd efflux system membrane fusion protein n=1 Tax=hydrocarbon metagenome TaxID=938273 RepID=A0A0W8E927_9ZZZZ
MKKGVLWAMVAVLSLSLLVPLGCNKEQPPAEETVEPVGDLTVDAFGTVEAKTISELMINFQAQVEKIHVEVGQMVTADDILVTLDLSDIKTDIHNQQLEMKRLENDLQLKQVLHEKAQQDLERRQSLLDAGALTDTDYEDFELSVVRSANEIKSLEISISAAQSKLSRLNGKLYESPYLNGSVIMSPFQQGLIYQLNCSTGQAIDPNRSILSIMDLQTIYVEAEIPEEFIGEVKLEAEVVIVPVSDSSRKYHGRVMRIYDMAEERNGETIIPIEVSVDDYDQFLKPNYNVDVQISTDTKVPAK